MEQDQRPINIIDPVQLLVEGKDPRNFFEKFIKHLGLTGVQLQDFGGIGELTRFLQGFVVAPRFGSVKSIGIVRDAERQTNDAPVQPGHTPALSAFHSVQSSLRNARLPIPRRPAEEIGRPAVSVFILPGNRGDGMLETLLCETFADSAVDHCIDGFFSCTEAAGSPISRGDKARARAYLVTKPHPHVSVGVAAQKGYWDFEHGAFDGVRGFLEVLARGRP
ncbi:MAG: hypothetical protein OXQ29_10930 [Rhodospirillaceae bacterium]|nr:hypothetical protein [Rhodospirillaceae bacterium]